ncbi:MAG: peptide-methionine (S)-S-oxide reductase MsrA [Pseudomonadota bacterium]
MLSGALATVGVNAYAADKTAIFAGGCFWCIEKDFEHVAGVKDVVSGYTGGTTTNPTYKNHVQHGHREVVQITYDSNLISYEQLLHIFWRSVDPTDDGGQFCDRGHSYTTAIYTAGEDQWKAAQDSKKAIVESKKLPASIVTPIEVAVTFYPAEDYHQDFYKKSPVRYTYYRRACGRDSRVRALWGDEAHSGIKHGS